jgi:hypothetical protein
MRRYLPMTVTQAGDHWIATNRYLSLFGIGPSKEDARRDLVEAAKELRTDLRAHRNELGPWPLRCLRYFERKTLR